MYTKCNFVLDPPKRIFIDGPDSVTTGHQAEFNCIVEGGSPVPIPILVVTDQYQNPLAMTPTSNTSVSVMVTKHHQNIYASCFAGNEAGFLQNTKEIAVHCKQVVLPSLYLEYCVQILLLLSPSLVLTRSRREKKLNMNV